MENNVNNRDLLVFSHLRWDFIFRRPQHLMARFAKHRRVFYVEEPIFDVGHFPILHIKETKEKVNVVVPHLPHRMKKEEVESSLKELIDELLFSENINNYALWYYTSNSVPSAHLQVKSVFSNDRSYPPSSFFSVEEDELAISGA